MESDKKLTVKEKNEVILTAKKIIAFCKSNCNVKNGLFSSKEKAISETERISQHGDISSVRRACKLIFENLGIVIEPIISEKKQAELDMKDKIKRLSNPTLQIERGKILLEF
jgi:hypothetical protein